jgi:hypothetical protein
MNFIKDTKYRYFLQTEMKKAGKGELSRARVTNLRLAEVTNNTKVFIKGA